ncbi:MFS transporter [Thiomicrorhabdus lithotrophica]|uniref:MFS transporter n=1 Tax=Thiomicrorhabdus lithotrophica TaxID=2949997 RepID=A0ABY8CAM7_9GAMM|nr:MFS transporter [Thiomicrorhabdus lithotrophica]WEJ61867.1 MFS transporter [Thiomicrorhabdus lithotrophica]
MRDTAINTAINAPLSKPLFIRYGWLGFTLAMLGIPLYVYLPTYYAQQSAFSFTAVGTALLLARSLDVITDPLIGWWSDWLQAKVSRSLQIALSNLVLAIGVYHLWLPNLDELNTTELFVWSFITYLAWTWMSIPYLALAAEISTQAHAKTQLSGAREGFAIVGVVTVLVLPILSGLNSQSVEFYQLLFIVFAITLATAVLALIKLPTLAIQPAKPIAPWKLLLTLKQKHPHTFSIMPSYFLNNFANALPATLFLVFVSDYLQLEEQTGLFLMTYFLAGLVALPFWIKLSKHIGKYKTWQLSMLLASISFIGVFFLNPGDSTGFLVISILTGLSLGIDVAMPASIQSDLTQRVVKQEIQATGLLFGLWGMLTKLALALAVGVAFPILDWSATLSNQALALVWLYAGLPIILKLMAWGLLIKQQAKN